MSKGRQKNKSQLEVLRGQIRELEAENETLKKIIKELEKDPSVKKKRQELREKAKKANDFLCPECGKAELEESTFRHLIYEVCPLCKFKRKVT
jgi:predicted RNA-binding Zn-ribbon protein involved in translation (DUF1610 family)